MADPNRYDLNRADQSRGVRDNRQAHDYIRSTTPEQRRQLRDAETVKRLQATTKGSNGIEVTKNVHQLDPLQAGGRTSYTPVLLTVCMNGVPAAVTVMAEGAPYPIS